jgi:hypothetical protein
MVDRFGEERLRDLLQRVRSMRSFDRAFQRSLDMSPAEVRRAVARVAQEALLAERGEAGGTGPDGAAAHRPSQGREQPEHLALDLAAGRPASPTSRIAASTPTCT